MAKSYRMRRAMQSAPCHTHTNLSHIVFMLTAKYYTSRDKVSEMQNLGPFIVNAHFHEAVLGTNLLHIEHSI